MFKIDLKKWRADLRAEEDSPLPGVDRLTQLYSIRAHARGRVHRTRTRVVWHSLPYALRAQALAGCGSLVVTLGLEDQEKWLDGAWKAYEAAQAPQELLVAEVR